MSDFNSSLPIRTETNGDAAVKIVDGTITSQQLTVNADGSLNITDNAGSLTVDGTVELGATTLAALESITVQNGAGGSAVNIQDGGNSITVDGTVELGATTLAALESITVQNGAGASAVNIQDGGNSITVDGAVSVSNLPSTVDTNYGAVGASTIRTAAQLGNSTGAANFGDGATGAQTLRVAANLALSGTAVSASNPIPVALTSDLTGTEVNDYSTSATLAAGGTFNHDYTVTALKTLLLTQIEASASGKMKIEVRVETAAGSGTFNTKFVQFNSTAETNMSIHLASPIQVVAGAKVRVICTNRDSLAQDVYSTISGQEV